MVETTEEIAFLMRILAVAHRFFTVDSDTQPRGVLAGRIEVGEDCTVVGRRNAEGLLGEETTFGKRGSSPVALQSLAKVGILIFGGHYGHIVEIFGSGTDQGDTAYIYFFNNICLRCTRCHGSLKRIKIDNHEINRGNLIFLDLGRVALIVAPVQDTAEHFGVKRLYPASQNRGIARKVFHGIALIAETFDKRARSACREETNAIGIKKTEDFFKTIFVKNRNQRGFYFFHFIHFGKGEKYLLINHLIGNVGVSG